MIRDDLAGIRLAIPPRTGRGGEWDWFFELSFGRQQACRRHMVRGGMSPDHLAAVLGIDIDAATSRWLDAIRLASGVGARHIDEWSDIDSQPVPDDDVDLIATRGLAGPHEAAAFLGVSRQRVHQLRQAGRFPAPFATLTMGDVWTIEQLMALRTPAVA